MGVCDDLISRQDAIDLIHKTIYGFFDIVDNGSEEPMSEDDKLLLEVNKAVSNGIKELPTSPRWIPVSKRLPENERYVLVTTVGGDVTEAKYWQEEGLWVKGLVVMSVTAWMPFMEPYKERETMSRYINAEKLIDFKFAYITNERYKDGKRKSEEEIYAYKVGYNEAIDNITRFATTADVVEVVRCKDCKYKEGSACDYSAVYVRPNGYCQWGEKEDENLG